MATRKIVVVGDKTTTGGVILPNVNSTFSLGDAAHKAALIGGPVQCPACKSNGTIAKAGGPRRMNFMGEVALENDIVLCGCSTPPKLVADLHHTMTYDDGHSKADAGAGHTRHHADTKNAAATTDQAAKNQKIALDRKKRLEENEEYLKNKNVKAFISAIAAAEGGDYDLKYGGVKGKKVDKWKFTDYSTHPGVGVDGKTTAAGMYQINIDTWKEMGKKMGLADFSPGTQDLLAVEILRAIGVINDIVNGIL